MRLDQYLYQNGFFDSRNKASAAIKNGSITVNEIVISKPSFDVSGEENISLQGDRKVYVARSAHKLLRAYQQFDLNWEKRVIADLGASTGGFCQVLLENNVKKVYAVDIGTAQLHPSLEQDSRIINLEHTNARFLDNRSFPEPIDCITADLSFISIQLILPAVERVLPPKGEAVVLIKPQFEAGKQHLNKSGVVTDRKVHIKVLNEVINYAKTLGFGVKGISFSGLSGESGNREYLLHLQKDEKTTLNLENSVLKAVYEEEEYA